ncbi:MAG: hypothetical protein ACW99U_17505 [Candidatus Thorarchaeota archaeon]|jgi:hypothetical protein
MLSPATQLVSALNGLTSHATTRLLENPAPAEEQALVALAEESIALAERILTLATVYSFGAGFGAGKIVDTDENPSNFKTAATLIGANIVQGVATAGTLRLMEDTPISYFEMTDAVVSGVKMMETLASAAASTPETQSRLEEVKSAVTRFKAVYYTVSFGSLIANFYHGYRRHDGSIGMGLAWGLLGGTSGTGLALAQGYAKPISQ